MASALEALLSRGDYMFRVEVFVLEWTSQQDVEGMKAHATFYLTCESNSSGWPQSLFPSDVRIVATRMASYDKTEDGQTVLGLIRRDAEQKVQVMLLAPPDQASLLLASLNTERRPKFLKLETLKKVESWDGEGWIAVLSWGLVLGK